MIKKELKLTATHDFIAQGIADITKLNPLEWFNLINLSLDACTPMLRKVAENNGDSMTFESILNHPLKNGECSEKRITPKEIADTLPKALFSNDQWMFMPVKTLATGEEKGQFFERQLFILADLALLMIVDTFFRKEPKKPSQRFECNPPLIDENVVKCDALLSSNAFGMPNYGFTETIMPYLEDPEMKLGEYIIKDFLDCVVIELRKAQEEMAERSKKLRPFLNIRTHMGIWNHL